MEGESEEESESENGDGEGRWTGELHDGTKIFANSFLPFRNTNSFVNPFLGAELWISRT